MNDFSNLICWKKNNLPHKSGIYLFENIYNKKVYVGQAQDISIRIRNHFSQKDELYFHRALSKYGEIGFNIYILEYTEIKDLDNQEIYYINKYQSNNPKLGYNLTSGGQGHLGCKHTEESKQKISEAVSKFTWAFNFKTNEFIGEESREKLSEKLNLLGYEMNPHRITDAIRHKSYSNCFTFGNSKEEALENYNNITLPKEYKYILYNYKTEEWSDYFYSISDGENYIREQGYKLSSGHLHTAIKNNNKYIKDFIFGSSKEEILKKLKDYKLITYVYNLNDNSLYKFLEANTIIIKKLQSIYPEIKLNQSSVDKVKKNKQQQTGGFILDSDLFNLIVRVSKYNTECSNKILSLAKEKQYLNSQELINWQDNLNKVSISY